MSVRVNEALRLLGSRRGTLDYLPEMGGFAYVPGEPVGGHVTGDTIDLLEARGLARIRASEGHTYLVLTMAGAEELKRWQA